MARVKFPSPMEILATALGVPRYWQWFTLHCPSNDIATVECEYIPEPIGFEEDGEVVVELAKYELQRKEL